MSEDNGGAAVAANAGAAAAADSKAAAAAAGKEETYSAEFVAKILAEKKDMQNKLRLREEAERKAEEEKLKEAGKLQELLAAKEKEIEALGGLKGEIEKYRAAEEARREKLLKELPKEKRELYGSVSIEVLEDLVASLSSADPTKRSKPGPSDADKSFDEMTQEERVALKIASPERYQKLYREWYKKKNGVYPPFA